MNIAIVASDALSVDNQRASILAAAREMGREHRVTIYTRRNDAERRAKARVTNGVTIEQIDAGPARDLPSDDVMPYLSDVGSYLNRRWSHDRPDVVHAHSWTGGLAAIAGATGLGVPVTQTFHTFGSGRRGEHLKLERALGRRAAAVIAGCADEEEELIRLGVPRNNIAVVPYGVDIEKFRRGGATTARGSRKRLLHVGPLSADRGAPTVIRALAGLPDVELVIAGGPPADRLHDDFDARQLRKLAEQSGVADRVTLLGLVPRASVPKLMRSADVVLSLPREVPAGMVALEAMACGVPVIASAVGAHLDAVVNGVTGLLVAPDRPAETARLTRALLADQTVRTAIGFAGADRARSRYSWERISQELVRVYEEAAH